MCGSETYDGRTPGASVAFLVGAISSLDVFFLLTFFLIFELDALLDPKR